MRPKTAPSIKFNLDSQKYFISESFKSLQAQTKGLLPQRVQSTNISKSSQSKLTQTSLFNKTQLQLQYNPTLKKMMKIQAYSQKWAKNQQEVSSDYNVRNIINFDSNSLQKIKFLSPNRSQMSEEKHAQDKFKTQPFHEIYIQRIQKRHDSGQKNTNKKQLNGLQKSRTKANNFLQINGRSFVLSPKYRDKQTIIKQTTQIASDDYQLQPLIKLQDKTVRTNMIESRCSEMFLRNRQKVDEVNPINLFSNPLIKSTMQNAQIQNMSLKEQIIEH